MYGEFRVPSFVGASRCYKTSSFFLFMADHFAILANKFLVRKLNILKSFKKPNFTFDFSNFVTNFADLWLQNDEGCF